MIFTSAPNRRVEKSQATSGTAKAGHADGQHVASSNRLSRTSLGDPSFTDLALSLQKELRYIRFVWGL